jgi:hypothetical protein
LDNIAFFISVIKSGSEVISSFVGVLGVFRETFDSGIEGVDNSGEFLQLRHNISDLFINFVSKFFIISLSGGFSESFGGFGDGEVLLDSVTDGQKFFNDFLVGVDFFFHGLDHDVGHNLEETEMFVGDTSVVFDFEVLDEVDDTHFHGGLVFQELSGTRNEFCVDDIFDGVDETKDNTIFLHGGFESNSFGFSLGVEDIKHIFSGGQGDFFGV